ncbi:hypothetical protein COCNU_scaffold014964G000010 [Cocos nucifera]|nr:hypothetical protein [Cocos nucifera]
MMNFPVPSWSTTRAIAHFRRPVPMIFWAAKPPGSLDFTYFSKLIPSRSAVVGANTPPATAATAVEEEEATIAEGGFLRRGAALGLRQIRGRESVCGFEEIWEEKEREEKEEVREEREIAIGALFSSLLCLRRIE